MPDSKQCLWLFPLFALTVFTLSSNYSYPLFHSLAEGFSVFISFGLFILAWNTRSHLEDDYLLLLGIISLCCGAIDTFHLFSYKGIQLFRGYDSDLPTSLWIASRYLQSILFALATARLLRAREPVSSMAVIPSLVACTAVTALLIWSVFAGLTPRCYQEGIGLTAFKKISELIISALFALSGALLWRCRSHFESRVTRLLFASIAASLAAEFCFIFYVGVFDLSNQIGHLCKVLSQYFIYRAIILTGLRRPLDLLFRQLQSSRQQLLEMNDSLEQTVRERTAQLENDIEARKQVEADLAQQTSLLCGLLHSIPDLVFFKDPNGVYLGCNSEFSRFVGRRPEDIIGRTDYDLVCPQMADFFRGNDRIMMEQGEPRHNEEWVTYPDGDEVLLDTLKAPLRSIEGKTIGLLGVSRDITQVKAHEMEIERLKDLYAALSQVNQAITRVKSQEELFLAIPRLLVEFGKFSMVWIGWLNRETGQVEVVTQYGDVSGYLNDIGIFADCRPEGRGPTGTAVREGRSYVCNDFAADPNTEQWRERAVQTKWRSSAAFPIKVAEVPRGALTVYAQETDFFGIREVALLEEATMDISFALDNFEREAARVQGVKELRKLTRAVAQSPVSIVITDVQGVIEFVNPKFTELTGYRADEVLGKTPSLLKSGQVPREVYRDLWATISSGRIWKGELINKKKNGELFREHATISPIKNPDGEITHFLATKEDITDQYLLKEQLLQSQKMEAVGQLAGGVAHDFNNILTVIMGYANILELRPSLTDADREAVAHIYAASEKAVQVTRGLLAFSRKQVLDPKPVNLNDIVMHVQTFLVRIIGEDVKLESHCQDGLLPIQADAGQIEQVLINLVTNARDAMPCGGVLTVATHAEEIDTSFVVSRGCGRPGSYACLSVTDTGTGIDEATGKRIFEPFFTTKEAGKGTGLGMSIVHGIVSQHDGFICFDSGPGAGTRFDVYLPLIDRIAITDGSTGPAEAVPGGSETILIAEDDAEVRRITESVLMNSGYRVLIAEDGQQAVDQFAQSHSEIRLILMDMIMPNKSGFDAYQEIRELDPGVKVLFTSGYTSDYFENRGELDAGAQLLMKPIRPQDLLKAVRSMLDT